MPKRKEDEHEDTNNEASTSKIDILADIEYNESSSSDEESKGYIRLRSKKQRIERPLPTPTSDAVITINPSPAATSTTDATPAAAKRAKPAAEQQQQQQQQQPAKSNAAATAAVASSSVAGSKGRDFTVSIALPGSILLKQETDVMKTYLAGQIARAAAVFNVDEIVVFSEDGEPFAELTADEAAIYKDPNIFIARILQYLETPQYLRKKLFAQHIDLRYAGMLSPLDATHHLRIHEQCKFREGVIASEQTKRADIGLKHLCEIDRDDLEPNTRVTIEIKKSTPTYTFGKVVESSKPRVSEGLYWGYNVRLAQGISNVLAECPYEGGYDFAIGTSERGEPIDSVSAFRLPKFKHLMIVFGGPDGIEKCIASDQAIPATDPKKRDSSLLFTKWLNTCPRQGSRTIRTEEAILVTMSALRPHISRAQKLF